MFSIHLSSFDGERGLLSWLAVTSFVTTLNVGVKFIKISDTKFL